MHTKSKYQSHETKHRLAKEALEILRGIDDDGKEIVAARQVVERLDKKYCDLWVRGRYADMAIAFYSFRDGGGTEDEVPGGTIKNLLDD